MGSRIIVTVFILVFTACTEPNVQDSPAAYNDTIVAAFGPVQHEYNLFMEAIYLPEQNNLSERLAQLKEKSDVTLQRIQELEPYEQDSSLLAPTLALAQFYRDAAFNDFDEIVNLIEMEGRTVDDVAILDRLLLENLEEEKMKFKAFAAAQHDFARRHNIQLIYPDSLQQN